MLFAHAGRLPRRRRELGGAMPREFSDAAMLRSPHAHARIVKITVSEALALPGVVAVWGAAELPELSRALPSPQKGRPYELPVVALDHLETRFSFRTRMLDYLWATLPIVCTRGDHFAELVEREGLGLTVPYGDPEALAAAIRGHFAAFDVVEGELELVIPEDARIGMRQVVRLIVEVIGEPSSPAHSCFPAHLQYASASHQLTQPTG